MNPQELTFTMKDVGWLIGQLVVLAVVLWRGGMYINKIKQKAKDNSDEVIRVKDNAEKELDLLEKKFEEHKTIVFKKFSAIHIKMEKEKDENLKEFKLLNNNLSEIKGMLRQVLAKG